VEHKPTNFAISKAEPEKNNTKNIHSTAQVDVLDLKSNLFFIIIPIMNIIIVVVFAEIVSALTQKQDSHSNQNDKLRRNEKKRGRK
jgi:C4-dicarboxylate transporter